MTKRNIEYVALELKYASRKLLKAKSSDTWKLRNEDDGEMDVGSAREERTGQGRARASITDFAHLRNLCHLVRLARARRRNDLRRRRV